ncbi:hypothetical protein ABZ567_29000 [Streptomyces sp. NPDC016459]|uniref:hypothetical protein n=1 Tax=Streptomyces sp. NPDC016459 TaxID=3157190 RepID=UPI0033D896BD
MSRRGRTAALPEQPHRRPAVLEEGGLAVEHRDPQGRRRSYDFAVLPIPPAFQRSLAVLYAARCSPGGGWDSVKTSEGYWYLVRAFAEFLAGLEDVPQDVDRLTAAHWAAWRMSLPPRTSGYNKYATIAGLLQSDARLPQPVREAMAQRFAWESGREQAYRPEEFQDIRAAARRTFRAALLRIRENTGRLQSWRAGEIPVGSREWLVGEALDVLARTGDVPLYEFRRAMRRTHREALGGSAATCTWMRLFLSRKEATALAVLIVMELGLNATTVSELPVPEALPGTGEAGVPVYRLRLEKRRRAGHRGRFESRNLTDSGAGSSGRVITEALEATAAARAVVALTGEAPNRLLVWHQTTGHERQAYLKPVRVGPFGFGVDERAGRDWARSVGLPGSPLRRLRRTVNVLHRREPGQNTQDTHDQVYVLPEPQIREAAVPVITAGALDAVASARRTVFAARLADQPQEGDRPTATTHCADFEHGPFGPPGRGCTASFLLCTACPNARVTPAHHPRLAYLHQALTALRGVLGAAVWEADWADSHARLDDLRARLGETVWATALGAVTGEDRAMITHLLQGDFDL